jgi:hypothetical protein
MSNWFTANNDLLADNYDESFNITSDMGSEADEVLVHITTPCTRDYDLRVASLAQAIRDFRPAIVTKVSGYDDQLPLEHSANSKCDPRACDVSPTAR